MSSIPEDWQARNGRYVSTPCFEDYSEKYADYFAMTRRDGVVELRMHTDGGPAAYGMGMHHAAINGFSPGHTEFALLCDITLASDDASFADAHLLAGTAPGDGMHLGLQELLGTKRAAYYLYTGAEIDARTALEFGLVNEVLPREKVLARAWELAETIRSRPKAARRLTHAIVSRPWKRRLVQDFGFGLAHEMFRISADKIFG